MHLALSEAATGQIVFTVALSLMLAALIAVPLREWRRARTMTPEEKQAEQQERDDAAAREVQRAQEQAAKEKAYWDAEHTRRAAQPPAKMTPGLTLWGYVLLITGLLLMFVFAFVWSAGVKVGHVEVNNIGLMADRIIGMIGGGVIFISGLACLIAQAVIDVLEKRLPEAGNRQESIRDCTDTEDELDIGSAS